MCERQSLDKICGVCGDKAKVRNFGAIVCESCKCFFRRTVPKTNAMKCSFNGKCVITKRNRKSCKRCRLDQCFAIGMRKELVMGKTKTQESDNSLSPGSVLSDDCSDLKLFDDFEFVVSDDQIIDGIIELEKFLDSQDSCPSKGSVAETLTFDKVIPIVKPIATFDKQLNDMEVNQILVLKKAASHFRDYTCYAETKYCSQMNDLDELYEFISSLNMFDQNILSAVKFAKTIDKFREMPETVQFNLLKANCYKLILLKNSYAFNFQEEQWTYAINNDYSIRYNLHIFKKMSQAAYEHCSQFWKFFDPEWIRDRTLIQLFMGIAVFSSNSAELTHKSFIKLSQQMYIYLLQRYLINKFGSQDKASQQFSNAMLCLSKFYGIKAMQRRVITDYGKYFSQLVSQILTD